jgi:hypothetical protein
MYYHLTYTFFILFIGSKEEELKTTTQQQQNAVQMDGWMDGWN